jgi:hypothetical protein
MGAARVRHKSQTDKGDASLYRELWHTADMSLSR